jgi:hypothetical protein
MATVFIGLLAALLGVLAPVASAAQLTLLQTRVAAIEHGPSQIVGHHTTVLPDESRQRAPNYDRSATGSSVAAEGGAGAARFVVDSNGEVTDLVGENPNAVSLGHYPDYIRLAQQTGARAFSMADEDWNSLSVEEQWAHNQQFLDQAIDQGAEIRLATPISEVKPGSFYEEELQYLLKQGFTPGPGGNVLLPPG